MAHVRMSGEGAYLLGKSPISGPEVLVINHPALTANSSALQEVDSDKGVVPEDVVFTIRIGSALQEQLPAQVIVPPHVHDWP